MADYLLYVCGWFENMCTDYIIGGHFLTLYFIIICVVVFQEQWLLFQHANLSQHTYVCFLLISLLKISFSNLKNKKLKYQTERSYYISNNKICTPVLKN